MSPVVRVVRACVGILGDTVGGGEVEVRFREGYVVRPVRVTWLLGGRVLLEMHSSLTLALDARDVEVSR